MFTKIYHSWLWFVIVSKAVKIHFPIEVPQDKLFTYIDLLYKSSMAGGIVYGPKIYHLQNI